MVTKVINQNTSKEIFETQEIISLAFGDRIKTTTHYYEVSLTEYDIPKKLIIIYVVEI